MLATYSVVGVCYSDAMIVVGRSQPLFKAAGGGQTIGHLTRSAGYRYLKKMIVSLVWSKKNNKEKRLFVVFFDLIIMLFRLFSLRCINQHLLIRLLMHHAHCLIQCCNSCKLLLVFAIYCPKNCHYIHYIYLQTGALNNEILS